MKAKTFLPILFILMVLFQVYVPASMVFNQERIYFAGTAYKMQLAPIDPNDPFRGKYIILAFRENITTIPKDNKLNLANDVYVIMKPGKNDFLEIDSIVPNFKSVKAPAVCIKASIGSISGTANGHQEAHIDYPFTRYYLEESKASEAEQRYLKAAADTNSLSYGLISVYNENVVVKDVIINGESLLTGIRKK